jgi:nicotinamidase-related amidase
MQSFSPARSVLLLIDLQARLMPAIADGRLVIANAVRLGEVARRLAVPVLGTEQNPAGLGPNVAEVRALTAATLAKTHFDATAEATFANFLPQGRPDVVVAGCETHVCVLQTVLGLRRAGRDVRVVRDAVGSRSPANREAALARMERYGAELVTMEMVAFEWLASSDHPAFRDVLNHLK